MLYIILIWIMLFILMLLSGNAACNFYALANINKVKINVDIFQLVWLGYAFIIGFSQLYSIFLPVDNVAVITILVLAIISLFLGSEYLKSSLNMALRNFLKHKIFYLFFIPIAFIGLAYFSARTSTTYDTHLYHLNAVKWASSYPAVPGIGNLHGRLAFNSSFHMLAAITNTWALKDRAVYIASGFLLLLALIQWFAHIVNTPKRGPELSHGYAIFTFPLFITTILSWDIPSLNTDPPFKILCLVIILELLKLREMEFKGKSFLQPVSGENNIFSWFLLPALVSVAITTKLAAAPFLILLPVSFLIILRYSAQISGEKITRRCLAVTFALPALIFLGYFVRNIILSGWMIYPVPVGNLHLDWSVSLQQVLAELNSIRSWAKMPGVPAEQVMSGGINYWFMPWLKGLTHNYTAVFLLVCFLSGVLSLFFVKSAKKIIKAHVVSFSLSIFTAIAGMIYWFITAPDFRFGEVYFWILAAVVLAPLIVVISWRHRCRYLAIVLLMIFAVLLLKDKNNEFVPLSNDIVARLAFPPKVAPVDYLIPLRINNGQTPPLIVYKPDNTDLCGNGTLPCSPYVNEESPLELRTPGKFKSGFRIREIK